MAETGRLDQILGWSFLGAGIGIGVLSLVSARAGKPPVATVAPPAPGSGRFLTIQNQFTLLQGDYSKGNVTSSQALGQVTDLINQARDMQGQNVGDPVQNAGLIATMESFRQTLQDQIANAQMGF